MTRKWHQLLMRMLHLSGNTKEPVRTDPNRDRLYKVHPLVSELQQRFEAVYKPSCYLAVDESLLLWKGALLLCQYIPLKCARFSIQAFHLCEGSGYTYMFHIYTGM